MLGLKLDITLPPGALEALRAGLAEAWWAGCAAGAGLGLAAGLLLGLLLARGGDSVRSRLLPLLAVLALAAGGWWLWQRPRVTPPATPAVEPAPPAPKRPWRPRAEQLVGRITLGGQIGPDGQEVDCDLPLEQRLRNIGSRVDGAGMCVSTSITMSARWHNLRDWTTWRDWCARFPGGGYPSKMDRQIKQYATERGITAPPYLQYEGRDLGVLRQALKAGLLPSVTYAGRDGVRYRGTIAHMVCLVYLSDSAAAIMDNNGPAAELIWMSAAEFAERWTGGRSGWAFIWLAPPPPPVPRNGR